MPRARITFGPAQHPNPITWERGGGKKQEREQEQQLCSFIYVFIYLSPIPSLQHAECRQKNCGVSRSKIYRIFASALNIERTIQPRK